MPATRKPKDTRWLMLIGLIALTTMACGLISRTMDSLVDSGIDALTESGIVENLMADILGTEGALDLQPLEHPDATFLFEIDPFDDVIRWRFYTVNASTEAVSNFYIELFPDFSVEHDETSNGERHLVLSSGRPLSGIYTAEALARAKTGIPVVESALLDVEVLHSTRHSEDGRLGIAAADDLLPEPPPADQTLVIIVYQAFKLDLEGITGEIPGVAVPGEPGSDLTDEGDSADDDGPPLDRETDLDLWIDLDLDDDRDPGDLTDLSGICGQVLGEGACYHPYYPVVEGFTRQYSSAEGVTTETITAVWDGGFTVTTEMPEGQVVSTDFNCLEEGIAGWTLDESILATVEQVPGELSVETAFEGSPLPVGLSVGDTWTVTITVDIGIQQAGVESKNIVVMTMDYTAAEEEIITTPMGRFSVLRVDFVSTGDNTLVITGPETSFSQQIFTLEGSGSDWYAECLGRVRSETTSSWQGIASVESQTTMELTNFGFR